MRQIKTGKFVFLCDSDSEEWRAQTLYTKEPGTIAWIEESLREGDVVFDIGANIGCYTLLMADRVGPNGRVIAFEPHVANAAALLKNIAQNGFSDRISVITAPLSHLSGEWQPFHYFSKAPGSSGSQLNRKIDEHGREFSPKGTELKQTATIDEIAEVWGVGKPNVIKIDVDGIELQILQGGLETLPKCRSVQVEIHSDSEARIIELFRGLEWEQKSKHHTASGTKQVEKGASGVTYNAIFGSVHS